MAKKTENTNQTEIAGAPAKRTRTPSVKHPLVIAAQAQVLEARMLAKVIDSIPKLGKWSLDQIASAVSVRRAELELASKA